jgi:hypothetical protein
MWRTCHAGFSTSRVRVHSEDQAGTSLPPSLSPFPFSVFLFHASAVTGEGSDRHRAAHSNPSAIVRFLWATTSPWAPTRPRPHRATVLAPGRAHCEGGSTVSPFLLSVELACGHATRAPYCLLSLPCTVSSWWCWCSRARPLGPRRRRLAGAGQPAVVCRHCRRHPP